MAREVSFFGFMSSGQGTPGPVPSGVSASTGVGMELESDGGGWVLVGVSNARVGVNKEPNGCYRLK